MKAAQRKSGSGPAGVREIAWGARAALALCGFSAVVGQIVLMRELIQVFSGNEISLGILLATWLVWTAAGSGLAGAAALAQKRPRLAVAALECILAASLPATIWALRSAKALFQTVPGELVGPVPMLLTSLVCLSVFCLASGSLFVAAARLAEVEGGLSARAAASTAYLLEAAGSALGGILASVALVRVFEAFQIAILVGLLNLAAALALVLRLKRRQVAALACAAAAAAVPLLVWVAPQWDAASRARLWRGFHLVASRDSIYGNITVTETTVPSGSPSPPGIDAGRSGNAIRSLYENGAILANAPDPAAAEDAVHYALLEHPAPRRVLLIGGGVNGAVAEALKHPTVERLDYVELDPALIGMARRYFPEQTAAFDSDPRVHLHFLDGRRFLAESNEHFDAILVDVPDPQTAQLNRFYTEEFFRLARAHLDPRGLLALELRSSEETISPDLAEFLRSIRRTLGAVFPYQAAIPGETIHFFGATQPDVLTSNPQALIARLHERRLATQYVREYFLPYRMAPDRMQQVESELAPAEATPVNRDFAPIAYAFDVVLWSAQFKSSYAAWFRAVEHVGFGRVASGLAIALAAFVGLMAVLPGRERRRRAAAGSCVAATGFTLMALQIFLLLGFQAIYGYVYTELAILIGLLMAGIALGSWLATRYAREETRPVSDFVSGHDFIRAANVAKMKRASAPERRFGRFSLPMVQLILALASPALLFAVSSIADLSAGKTTWLAAQVLFPALAALAGMLGGFQFVVAAGIFVRESGRSARLGTLYAIDLLGGCVGALALSTFLIPMFGFWKTAWLGAGINVAAVLVAVRACLHRPYGTDLISGPASPR